MRYLRGKIGCRDGLTIVEMAVVMTISAIVMTGLLIAYADGVREWRYTSERKTLHDEGMLALSLMGRFIRQADFIKIKSYSGLPDASLELRYPDEIGGGSARFYYLREAKAIRWNDQTEGRNKFNMMLIPAVNFRGEPGDPSYLSVKRASFTPLDDIGFHSPTLEGYSLVQIELTLEDADGDTLYLSSVASKRN